MENILPLFVLVVVIASCLAFCSADGFSATLGLAAGVDFAVPLVAGGVLGAAAFCVEAGVAAFAVLGFADRAAGCCLSVEVAPVVAALPLVARAVDADGVWRAVPFFACAVCFAAGCGFSGLVGVMPVAVRGIAVFLGAVAAGGGVATDTALRGARGLYSPFIML